MKNKIERPVSPEEYIEISEEDIFRIIGYESILMRVRDTSRKLIPFRRVINTSETPPRVSDEELRVRSSLIRFIHEKIGVPVTTQRNTYRLPIRYKSDSRLLRREFLEYFNQRKND